MLSFLLFEVGKSIEREVVVEVLFKPEVYVAEVSTNQTFIRILDIDPQGGYELFDWGCGRAGVLRQRETHSGGSLEESG